MGLQPFSLINEPKLFQCEHPHLLPRNPFFIRENNGLNFVTREQSFSLKQVIYVECELYTTPYFLTCYFDLIEKRNGNFFLFSYLK